MEFLIVGLGNPGVRYEHTRHNLGFMVADRLAERHAIAMKKEPTLGGVFGKGKIGASSCLLLKPTTWMNCSGTAVLAVKRENGVPIDHILIISDEVALPYGRLRLSEKGSCGGHRGLESIEKELDTQCYARLRMGVGDREGGDLADHVLGTFQGEELVYLPTFIDQAVALVEAWLVKKQNKEL